MKISFSKAFVNCVGNYRAFFVFHVEVIDDIVLFQYLVTRGEAYAKRNRENLRKKDE